MGCGDGLGSHLIHENDTVEAILSEKDHVPHLHVSHLSVHQFMSAILVGYAPSVYFLTCFV